MYMVNSAMENMLAASYLIVNGLRIGYQLQSLIKELEK